LTRRRSKDGICLWKSVEFSDITDPISMEIRVYVESDDKMASIFEGFGETSQS